MSEGQGPSAEPIRKILVALDASPHSLSALEAAAEIASHLHAELEGLFVEDVDILAVTQFPFARELSWFTGSSRQLETGQIEREIRAQGARMRERLAEIASRAQVPWRFRVTRGHVSEEVVAAAAEADLCLLGKVGWSLAGRRHVGSTVQAVLSRCRGPTLVLEKGGRVNINVLVFYNGSSLSWKALEMATRLFPPKSESITVFMLASDEATFKAWEEKVTQFLRAQGRVAECRFIGAASLQTLTQAVKQQGTGPVVIPGEGPFVESQAIRDLVNEIPNPVLMVRQAEEP